MSNAKTFIVEVRKQRGERRAKLIKTSATNAEQAIRQVAQFLGAPESALCIADLGKKNPRSKIWDIAMRRMSQILGPRHSGKLATRIAKGLPPLRAMTKASGIVNPTSRHRLKASSMKKPRKTTHQRKRNHKTIRKNTNSPAWRVFALKNGKRFYATGINIHQPFDTEKSKAKTYSTQAAALKIARAMARKTPHAVQLGVCT